MNRRNKGLSDNISCNHLPRIITKSVWVRFIFFITLLLWLFPATANQKDSRPNSLIAENNILCQNDTLRIRFEIALPADITDSLFFVHGTDTTGIHLSDDLKILSPPDSLRGIAFPTNRLTVSGNYKVFVRAVLPENTEFSLLSDDFELVKDVIINQDPLDVYVCQGDPVIFSVGAENYTTITWQYKAVNTSIWITDLIQSGKEYHVNARKDTNDKMNYRAKITNMDVCHDTSNIAVLRIDSIKPNLTCPNDTIIYIDKEACSYTFTRFPRPIIEDECGYNHYWPIRSDSKTAFEPIKVGTIYVDYNVSDRSGNDSICRFYITVENNDYLKIPCKEKETLYLDEFCRTKIDDQPLKILPPCDKDSVKINYAGTMNYTKVGEWPVRYFSYHDRILECTTQVTVLDTLKKLSYIPDALVTKDADPGKCTAVVLRKDPVIKSCTLNRDKIELISAWPVNDEFPVGETINQWQITWFDGIKDTLEQKIVVNDVATPIVNCPEETIEYTLDPAVCSEWIDLPELSKGFACGPVEVKNSRNGTDNASGTFQAGYTDFKWTVTHQGNMIKECPQQIVIFSKPTAIDDRITIQEDENGLVRILDNDDDCFGIHTLDSEILTSRHPIHGTAFLNAQFQIEYTPDQGYSGTDTIGYKILNSMGMIDSALVIITIEAKPEEPEDPEDPDIDNPPGQPCEFLIPDGFSPNGDGIGDRFYIRCIEDYPDARIWIFNRYGQLLYGQEKYGNIDFWGSEDAFWDGRPNRGMNPFHSILPAGTYFYRFDPGNGQEPSTGSIYLNTNIKGMKSHE